MDALVVVVMNVSIRSFSHFSGSIETVEITQFVLQPTIKSRWRWRANASTKW
jgi:hypothetical protein